MKACNVGDILYRIDGFDENGEAIIREFQVDEIRSDGTVVYNYPTGAVESMLLEDLFETQDDAIRRAQLKDLVVIMRETAVEGIALSVFPLERKDIPFLRLRSRYNPELEFFVTFESRVEDYDLLAQMEDAERVEELENTNIITRL